jgi:Na+-driven multidrug efflux pump
VDRRRERAVAEYETFIETTKRLLHPLRSSAGAWTVEIFGYLMLVEGGAIVIAPHGVALLLNLPEFSVSAATYFRLVGLLISGLGLLYTVSGRLNAQGFVFASLIDRPLVPFVMLGLWYWGLCPAILAAAFGLQDFGSFLWTLWAWRRDRRQN